MEWLNTHFIEPSTEEGDQLSTLDKPWEDELFWPYLKRYVHPHVPPHPATLMHNTVHL